MFTSPAKGEPGALRAEAGGSTCAGSRQRRGGSQMRRVRGFEGRRDLETQVWQPQLKAGDVGGSRALVSLSYGDRG